jgi:hypothetical protein
MKYLFTPSFVFPVEVLQDRCFYVNKNYVGGPCKSSVYFKKNSPIDEINSLLEKRVEESKTDVYKKYRSKNIREKTPYIHLYPEILFRKKLSVGDASHIIVSEYETKEHIEFLREHYPNLQLVLHERSR